MTQPVRGRQLLYYTDSRQYWQSNLRLLVSSFNFLAITMVYLRVCAECWRTHRERPRRNW